MKKEKVITFDLDGTLIQSSQFYPIPEYDFFIYRHWNDRRAPGGIKVKVRPGVKDMLQELSKTYYLALFTHSYPQYIEEVLSNAGLKSYFDVLCNNYDEINDEKDLNTVLEKLGFVPQDDLDKIIIIDDNHWCRQNNKVFIVPSYMGGNDALFDEEFSSRVRLAF